jgi:hypothetical protein
MQMEVVEFQGIVKDGVIQIPEVYQGELDGESVKVIIMKKVRMLYRQNITGKEALPSKN